MPALSLVQAFLVQAIPVQHTAQLAGSTFVAGLWQGTVLAAAVWLCLRCAPRTTAALRFVLWTTVLIIIALLPLVEAALPSHATGATLVFHADPRWSLILAALWLTLSSLRGAGLLRQTWRIWRLHQQAHPVPQSEAMASLLAETRRGVQICTSTQVERPGVIGFFAPRVLIPSWLYPHLTAPELEQIVLHEFEHLRRRDDWLNLIQKISLIVFPLNPILIAVERLLCLERELACDDGVLRRTHAPRLYATCLATLAERGLDRRSFSLALGALGDSGRHDQPSRSELGRRIHRILRRPVTASPLHARAAAAAVGLVITCVAIGLGRCPQIVSFVPASPAVAAVPSPLPPMPIHPQVMHVVYADAQTAAPHLIQSSLVLRLKSHAVQTHRQKPASKPVTQFDPSRMVAAPEAALLLTSFPEQDRPRLLTLDETVPAAAHFAIVRVDGGWILVQL